MNMNFIWTWLFLVVITAPTVITVVYLAARAGAFAYFRTKREYMQTVLKDFENGEHDEK